jgi:GNAT superfamily N-acetyltransferase
MTTGIARPVDTARDAPPGAAGAAALGLRLRVARPDDAARLAALYARCTPESRFGRFHGLLHELPSSYLREALTAGPALHEALVLETPANLLVALASGRRVEPGPAVEIGLLVEDGWQRRGLGTLLLTSLAARARGRSIRLLRCDILASRRRLVEVIRRTLGPVTLRWEGDEVHVEVRL